MRVFIADPQAKVRHALTIWVSKQPGWEVAGEAATAQELCARLGQLAPGVVILDRDLPGLLPAELVALVRRSAPRAAIILMTNGPIERRQAEALQADFTISKLDSPDRMLEAITQVQQRFKHT
jgi:DNA-binding NarL/FixJ family response regulator